MNHGIILNSLSLEHFESMLPHKTIGIILDLRLQFCKHCLFVIFVIVVSAGLWIVALNETRCEGYDFRVETGLDELEIIYQRTRLLCLHSLAE